MSTEARIIVTGGNDVSAWIPLTLSGEPRLTLPGVTQRGQNAITMGGGTSIEFTSGWTSLPLQVGGVSPEFAQHVSLAPANTCGPQTFSTNLSATTTFLVDTPNVVSWAVQTAVSNAATSSGRERVTNVELRVSSLFDTADLVEFEDGFENEFTHRVKQLVKTNGVSAVAEIAAVLFRSQIHSELVAQILLCLGRIEDDATYYARSAVLQCGLSSLSADVRDAAAVGIASMSDLNAIPSLERAVAREIIKDLKVDMQKALLELKRTA